MSRIGRLQTKNTSYQGTSCHQQLYAISLSYQTNSSSRSPEYLDPTLDPILDLESGNSLKQSPHPGTGSREVITACARGINQVGGRECGEISFAGERQSSFCFIPRYLSPGINWGFICECAAQLMNAAAAQAQWLTSCAHAQTTMSSLPTGPSYYNGVQRPETVRRCEV